MYIFSCALSVCDGVRKCCSELGLLSSALSGLPTGSFHPSRVEMCARNGCCHMQCAAPSLLHVIARACWCLLSPVSALLCSPLLPLGVFCFLRWAPCLHPHFIPGMCLFIYTCIHVSNNTVLLPLDLDVLRARGRDGFEMTVRVCSLQGLRSLAPLGDAIPLTPGRHQSDSGAHCGPRRQVALISGGVLNYCLFLLDGFLWAFAFSGRFLDGFLMVFWRPSCLFLDPCVGRFRTVRFLCFLWRPFLLKKFGWSWKGPSVSEVWRTF